MPFKPFSNPIMVVSDNPTYPTGLARQSRDIATLLCTLPQFRVGYLGRGIGQDRRLPFILYDYPLGGQWGEGYIQKSWENFSEGDTGIILTCDDLSRRQWLVNPTGLPSDLAHWVSTKCNHYAWGYVPVDSTGPNGVSLSVATRDTALRYDRMLAASEWGCNVLKASGRADADWLPHGIWMDKFHPVSDAKAIQGWEGKTVVGCVMTNQARKDWGVAFEAFAVMHQHYKDTLHIWLHVDTLINYWNLYALAADYGVSDLLEVTTQLNDNQLATHYSGCDCTLLPSAGEGFGFPIAESMACGTACVVSNYGAGPELSPAPCCVAPHAYRVDTAYNTLRPVLSGHAFAVAAKEQIELKQEDPEYRSGLLADSVSHLDWTKLRVPWTRWLLEGLR